MKKIRISIVLFILVSLFCVSCLVYNTQSKIRVFKEDIVELSNIKYGLFNVDEWKKILSNIITKKIEEFEISKNGREEMKKKYPNFFLKLLMT